MSILGFARTYRGLRRTLTIGNVLARHGFGPVVHQLNLGIHIPFRRRFSGRPVDEQLSPERAPGEYARRLRTAFEELGPTFVKLGQLLSGRPDLVPEPYLNEFKLLQDQVAPFPAGQARQIVERELKRPLAEVFSEFSDEPLASGSIAQVHCAVTVGGQAVVVKVRRPGIARIIKADLFIMEKIAELLPRLFPEADAFQPTVIVEEFSASIHRELDFITEASSTQQFAKIVEGCEGMRVPKVYWDYTTSQVLVLEHIEGCRIEADPRIASGEIDRKALARRIGVCFFRQYFSEGAFHADPHPGNLLLCPDGRVTLLDFGMVGRLGRPVVSELGNLLAAIYQRDTEAILIIATDLGSTSNETDEARLATDMIMVLDKYFGMPMKFINKKELFLEVTAVANRHRLRLPRDLVMLGKSFETIVSTMEWLDPDCDITDIAAPFARAGFFKQFDPKRMFSDAQDIAVQLNRLGHEAPRALRRLLRNAVRGEFQVQFKHTGLERFALDIDRSSNRLSLAVIVGAIIIGTSTVVATANVKIPVIGEYVSLIGFGLAVVLGLLLVIGIFKSGKL